MEKNTTAVEGFGAGNRFDGAPVDFHPIGIEEYDSTNPPSDGSWGLSTVSSHRYF